MLRKAYAGTAGATIDLPDAGGLSLLESSLSRMLRSVDRILLEVMIASLPCQRRSRLWGKLMDDHIASTMVRQVAGCKERDENRLLSMMIKGREIVAPVPVAPQHSTRLVESQTRSMLTLQQIDCLRPHSYTKQDSCSSAGYLSSCQIDIIPIS